LWAQKPKGQAYLVEEKNSQGNRPSFGHGGGDAFGAGASSME